MWNFFTFTSTHGNFETFLKHHLEFCGFGSVQSFLQEEYVGGIIWILFF